MKTIPAAKLTDKWGRKRCFTLGLPIYGIGALMSALSPGVGVLLVTGTWTDLMHDVQRQLPFSPAV